MSENLEIKAEKETLFDYIKKFQEGKIQVPAFQRDFVWTNEKKLELFDSIQRGYPIGSVLFWRPNFKSDADFYKFESEKIGSYSIPSRDTDYFYILDGYQRLSTLFGCLLNPNKTTLTRDEKEWKKEFNIVYNLEDDAFEINKKNIADLEYFKIPVYRLIDGKEFFQFQRRLFGLNLENHKNEEYLEKYENISNLFQTYELPSMNIYGGSISEAVDIFQRLNSRGAPITVDWVVSALSFNKDRNFKLGAEIEKLLSELSIYNFQNQKREVILQCITNSFGSIHFDKASKGKKLEELAKQDNFIDISNQTIANIKKAVSFLFKELLVLDSKLLPYNNQLIFITDFFNKIKEPKQSQLDSLERWFWITTYSNYFTIYNLSKQRLAYNQFQEFLENENIDPVYYDKSSQPFETLEFPVKIDMGSVRAKALALFMLNYEARIKQINPENINNYKAFKLFTDFGTSAKDINISENTILVIEEDCSPIKIKKTDKDLSNWLNLQEDLTAFFISSEMTNTYLDSKDKELVLNLRKENIIKHERKFVETLLLKYET